MPATMQAVEPLAICRDDFPDPFAARPEARHRIACANQRRRRSTILANARCLLADEGYGGVELRAVAERSSVSIQTVYNLVGNRTTMLAEAVVEHIAQQGQLAMLREGYPDPLLALADVYWEGAALYPRYTHNATLTYYPPDRPLYEQTHRCGVTLLRDALRRMEAGGMLRSIDQQSFASRIAAFTSITVLNGLSEPGALLNLRRELVASIGLMMMSVATPSHAARIDAWLNEFERCPLGQIAA